VWNAQIGQRANTLYGYEEVPDREPTDRDRRGIALSALFQPLEDLDLTVDYYGMKAEDLPDIGGYLVDREPADNVPVYAQKQDFLESDVDTFTARVRYHFTPAIWLNSATATAPPTTATRGDWRARLLD
jgi:catecholate siderophore receptor